MDLGRSVRRSTHATSSLSWLTERRRLRWLARWTRFLSRKRVVSVLNLSVFFALIWQMTSLIRMGFDVDLPSEVLKSLKLEELPYPLDIVVQVRRKNITLSPLGTLMQSAGYVDVREGTFRSKYPSTHLEGTGTFDGVFVITNEKCERQWEQFQILANKIPLSYTKWPVIDSRHVSLEVPLMPIASKAFRDVKTGNRAVLSIIKRQLSYLEAHRRLWKFVIDTGKQRVLVIDDTLFPNERLRKSLPALLNNADQESVARQQPWHYIFLRRQKLLDEDPETMWSMNPVYNHAVVAANASHGTGAYVLSLAGARFLHKHITRYRAPLDVEIGLTQRDFPNDFIALSACNNDLVKPFCPEIIEEIPVAKGRQVFDCVWRRVQERSTAMQLVHYFRSYQPRRFT